MPRRRQSLPVGTSSESRDRISQMAAVVANSKTFRPAREILKRVRAVPTILPAMDWKLGVGGWPIERLSLIHGASGEGKTTFMHALGLSFLRRGHFYLHVDAERTTPITWMESLFEEFADSPLYLAARPKSYEQTVDAVRELLTNVAEARVKGKIPQDSTVFAGIDSLRKLIPQRLLEKIMKEGAEGAKGSVDGMSGRAAMFKAALNSSWVDELIPLLDDSQAALMFIAREYENSNADPWAPEWRVGGGKAVYFDSSLVGRVSRKVIYGPGEGKDRSVYAERHQVVFRKTKIAGKEERDIYSFFHSSNGSFAPVGFDLARDLVELGIESGELRKEGATLTWGKKRWQGTDKMVAALYKDRDLLTTLDQQVRGRFGFSNGMDLDARIVQVT